MGKGLTMTSIAAIERKHAAAKKSYADYRKILSEFEYSPTDTIYGLQRRDGLMLKANEALEHFLGDCAWLAYTLDGRASDEAVRQLHGSFAQDYEDARRRKNNRRRY